MNAFPILFTYRELVAGNGFLVGVETAGRAIVEESEDGRFWVFGVNPGCLSSDGDTRDEALSEFKQRWVAILNSVACDAKSLPDFMAEVQSLFSSESDVGWWDAAVSAVHEGGITVDWCRSMPAEATRGVTFKDFTSEMKPEANPDPFEHEVSLAKCA
jgi:predicted RNase H-like HicB family nuclease